MNAKLIIAGNPWRLAAEAKRQGVRGIQFVEFDGLPTDRVYVVDLEEAARMLEELLERPYQARGGGLGDLEQDRDGPLGWAS